MPEFVSVKLTSPTGSESAIGGANGRIEVIAAGMTIRVGSGFDAGDLRRVLQIVRELA
jgi:hypothetical protein